MEADLAVLDELQAEYELWVEQGDHGDECPCAECVGERDADQPCARPADLEYERITSGR